MSRPKKKGDVRRGDQVGLGLGLTAAKEGTRQKQASCLLKNLKRYEDEVCAAQHYSRLRLKLLEEKRADGELERCVAECENGSGRKRQMNGIAQ